MMMTLRIGLFEEDLGHRLGISMVSTMFYAFRHFLRHDFEGLKVLSPSSDLASSQCGQHPVGLIAQSVQDCTGIAEGMGSNPFQT